MLPTARHRGLHNGKASDGPYMVDEGRCGGVDGATGCLGGRFLLATGTEW